MVSGPQHCHRTRAECLPFLLPPRHRCFPGGNALLISARPELPALRSGYYWWQPAGLGLCSSQHPPAPRGTTDSPRGGGEGVGFPVTAFSAIPILSARNTPRSSPKDALQISTASSCPGSCWKAKVGRGPSWSSPSPQPRRG